jgi:hypothetical protein
VDGVCSGCVYFFPLGELSSKARISGQLRKLFESLKNNELFCCPANPFLDTWFRFMDSSVPQAISVGIYNYLLFIDIDAFREKTHVHVKYQVMLSKGDERTWGG